MNMSVFAGLDAHVNHRHPANPTLPCARLTSAPPQNALSRIEETMSWAVSPGVAVLTAPAAATVTSLASSIADDLPAAADPVVPGVPAISAECAGRLAELINGCRRRLRQAVPDASLADLLELHTGVLFQALDAHIFGFVCLVAGLAAELARVG